MKFDLLGILASAVNEEFVPADDWRGIVAVPAAILLFFGSIFLLLRSNLGTKRAYLVEASAFFGFMLVLSAFWTFGAPGTPQATGPTNLPGQIPNEYQPTWTPFAGDSIVAQDPRYDLVQDHPEGFEPVEEGDEFRAEAETGATDIQTFFASEEGGAVIGELAQVVSIERATATNGYPVIAVSYQPVDDAGEPTDEEPVVLFGFFDAGNPIFPGQVFMLISLVGFVLHVWLLDRDERMARRERAEVLEEEEAERVPAGAP